jgi:murein DD-endopeptidase MepM/ murein hydrolase activator NlpD
MKLAKSPNGDVTQWFGENPALYSRWGILYHNGIDLVRPHGSPMYAVEDATVVQVNNDPSGFGKHVRLISTKPDQGGNYREWVYGHASKQYVKVNDVVFAGQHIADMGNTGFVVSSSNANGFWKVNPYGGTHLHLGLRLVRVVNRGGWRYEGSNIRLSVVNYENGVRGAIDPVPYFTDAYTSDNVKMYEQLQGIQKIINSIKAFLSK